MVSMETITKLQTERHLHRYLSVIFGPYNRVTSPKLLPDLSPMLLPLARIGAQIEAKMSTKNAEFNHSHDAHLLDKSATTSTTADKLQAEVYNNPGGANIFKRMKEFKEMDTNRDRILSVDELITARKQEDRQKFIDAGMGSTKSEVFKTSQKAAESRARKEFAMYDHDHNKKVTPHEYVDFATGKKGTGVLPGLIIDEAKHIKHKLPHLPNLKKLF